jgi:hypothetical protein
VRAGRARASDLDGTIGVENIAHAALARSLEGMTKDATVHAILEPARG